MVSHSSPPVWLQNKIHPIKVTGITDTTSRVNMHSALKRAMLTPIMRSMGQPYYVRHDSLLVESRLLDIESLQSLSCVRLAHRWLSNHLEATNEAARMFRVHATNPPTHRCHPFNYIKHGVMSITALQGFDQNPHSLTQLDRNQLKRLVWDKQYTTWFNGKQTPLQQQYNTATQTQQTLPTYTHMDTPEAASNRARLRLARARLRYDQERMGFQSVTSTYCRECGKAPETVQHVIDVCDAPAVVDIRDWMRRKLTPSAVLRRNVEHVCSTSVKEKHGT